MFAIIALLTSIIKHGVVIKLTEKEEPKNGQHPRPLVSNDVKVNNKNTYAKSNRHKRKFKKR